MICFMCGVWCAVYDVNVWCVVCDMKGDAYFLFTKTHHHGTGQNYKGKMPT